MSGIRLRHLAGLTAVLAAAACGGGIVLPDESVPADIVVVDGDAQFGPAGSTLAEPLVVQVTDERGRPVENQAVAFTVLSGGGQATPATATTDADGIASATWVLGPAAGAQEVRAQVTGSGVPAGLLVEFTATALAGSGSTLVMVSGDDQSAAVGSPLPDPLVVKVLDPLGNPVSGQTVAWSVTGGGSVDPTSSVTGADGQASTQRVLGPSAGVQTAIATAEGLAGSPVTFSHTAGASTPASLVQVSGNGQTAPAGFQLPDSLVVRLLDANGNGVAGRTVTWVLASGAGVVDPVNSQTDADGYAVTRWTLGTTAGSYNLNAVFSGLPSVGFTATATADVPTSIVLLSGDGQTAAVGTTLPQPLRVKITDANGNAVENVSVTWAAVGGGSVSSSTTGSNPQGVAEVSRTLGPTPGPYNTTAEVAGLTGSPVTFTATAEVGPAARLAFLTQPGSAQVGQPLSFQVEVQDAQGNRVTTAGNLVTISSSVAGTLNGDNTQNAVAGVASFSGLSLDQAGTGYTLRALASGLTNTTSEPFDIARGATTIAITGRTPPSSVTGGSVTFNYNADVVAPASGNLNGTVTVSDGTDSCTGNTSNSGLGSCAIAFSTAGARQVTATYNDDDPNFTGSVSPAFAVTVGKANATVTITSDDPDPSGVGEQVTVEYTVTGNGGGAAPTGNVTITVSGGSESCTGSAAAGSCQLTLTAQGARTLTATYPGDANYNGDTDTKPHSVMAATSTALTSSNNPSDAGESVTFTATVTSSSGTPSGNVQFVVDGADTGSPVALNGSGQAGFTTSSLSATTHQIGARYLGDPNFAPSTAPELTQTVNPDPPPTAQNDSYTVDEDGSLTRNAALGVLGNDSDNGPITASLVSGPTHAAGFTLNADGSFSYTPEADFFGQDGFTYAADDGSSTDQATVTITVTGVNDVPSFTKGADQTVSSLATSATGVTVAGWATDISAGPGEAGAVIFQVGTSDDSVFGEVPQVASDGTLTFRPNLRLDTAVITVTVVAEDPEGLTSAAQQFTITIDP